MRQGEKEHQGRAHTSEEVSAGYRFKDDAERTCNRERLLRGHASINSRPRVGKHGQAMHAEAKSMQERKEREGQLEQCAGTG